MICKLAPVPMAPGAGAYDSPHSHFVLATRQKLRATDCQTAIVSAGTLASVEMAGISRIMTTGNQPCDCLGRGISMSAPAPTRNPWRAERNRGGPDMPAAPACVLRPDALSLLWPHPLRDQNSSQSSVLATGFGRATAAGRTATLVPREAFSAGLRCGDATAGAIRC